MSQEAFTQSVTKIINSIAGRPLDGDLQAFLDENYPPDGEDFQRLADLCRQGVAEGWLCFRDHEGMKFGRVVKPSPESKGFSVDVVEMDDLAGPYHSHPTGEIDMIIPETEDAKFDGHGRGWLVYGPESAHTPTTSGGKAIILYLLPDGRIEFPDRSN